MSKPGRVGGIFGQLPFVSKATTDQRRLWYATVTQARMQAELRRSRVLAHPDLAQRLARSLGYTDPKHWNGYIPPRTVAPNVDHTVGINDSPIRRELLDILREVDERDG